MSNIVTVVASFLVLTSCGNNSNHVDDFSSEPLGNPFSVSKCGSITFEQGVTGGSTGHFLYENSTGQKFTLTPTNSSSQNTLAGINLQNSPQNGCVFSFSTVTQGFEGSGINADQVSINP